MRKELSEEINKYILQNYVQALPNKACHKNDIAECFENAYFHFIDTLNLPLLENFDQSASEKKLFIEILLKQVDKHSLKGLNGSRVLGMIDSYYRCQPTHGGLIYNKQKTKFLIVQNNSKKYGFPKGKIQKNQQVYECAKRQISEEIGKEINLNLKKYVEVNDRLRGACRFYLCRIDQKDVLMKGEKEDKHEIISHAWMSFQEVNDIYYKMNSLSKFAWDEFKVRLDKKIQRKLKNMTTECISKQPKSKNCSEIKYVEKRRERGYSERF